eukprot:scaffold9627_cov123-Isochrysis_galbana.AAC.7
MPAQLGALARGVALPPQARLGLPHRSRQHNLRLELRLPQRNLGLELRPPKHNLRLELRLHL